MMKEYLVSDLLQLIKRGIQPQHHLIFDCDGTLIDGDVSTLTGWQLMKAGMVDSELLPAQYRSPKFYTQMNLLDYDRVRKEIEGVHGSFYSLEWELLIQSGIPHQIVVDHAHSAIDFGFENKHVSFTSVLPDFLKGFLSQSWIVSGSSYPTVVALAEKLGLPDHRVLATRLELVDGIYQKTFAPPGFVWEAKKVTALQSVGVDRPYLVAGDSPGDWHMMQLASDWVWCVLWDKAHFGSKNYRSFLETQLPFGSQIPTKKGYYLTQWQEKNWIFEIAS